MSERIPRLAIDVAVACIAVLLLSGGAPAPRLIEEPTEVWRSSTPYPSAADARRLDRLVARVTSERSR